MDNATNTKQDEDSYSDIELKLIELITSNLKLSSLEVNDQYYIEEENSPKSVSLLNSINNVYGIKLQLKDLIEHPTTKKLSVLVNQCISKQKSLVIPLNKNRTAPPLFFICGITLYSPLAKNLNENYSCYGIYISAEESFLQSSSNEDSMTIPHLASLYLDAIKRHTPTGPYTIAGISFGGVLAFEIARQLLKAGEKIKGLIILDTVLPGSHTTGKLHFIKKLLDELKTKLHKNPKVKEKRHSATDNLDKQRQLLRIFSRKTTKRYFNGNPIFSEPTLIIRADDQLGYHTAPDLCWSPKLSGPIILTESPGTHLKIIQSKKTAEYIINYI